MTSKQIRVDITQAAELTKQLKQAMPYNIDKKER